MVSRIILPVLLVLVLGFGFSDAFALEHVSIPAGASASGCELTNQCYLPSTLNIPIGETVTWTNTDSAFHTVTSIDAFGAPDGIFDSGFIASGNNFSLIFDGIDGPNTPGTYLYFCQLHPWMNGEVKIDGPSPLEQIIAAIQTLQNAITQIGQALQGEIQARQAGDNTLQNSLNTETASLEARITALENKNTKLVSRQVLSDVITVPAGFTQSAVLDCGLNSPEQAIFGGFEIISPGTSGELETLVIKQITTRTGESITDFPRVIYEIYHNEVEPIQIQFRGNCMSISP